MAACTSQLLTVSTIVRQLICRSRDGFIGAVGDINERGEISHTRWADAVVDAEGITPDLARVRQESMAAQERGDMLASARVLQSDMMALLEGKDDYTNPAEIAAPPPDELFVAPGGTERASDQEGPRFSRREPDETVEEITLESGDNGPRQGRRSENPADATDRRQHANQRRTDRRAGGESEVARTSVGGTPRVGWYSATRVRRRNGQPATAARGARSRLKAQNFGREQLGGATGHPSAGLGVWFTLDRGETGEYGSVV